MVSLLRLQDGWRTRMRAMHHDVSLNTAKEKTTGVQRILIERCCSWEFMESWCEVLGRVPKWGRIRSVSSGWVGPDTALTPEPLTNRQIGGIFGGLNNCERRPLMHWICECPIDRRLDQQRIGDFILTPQRSSCIPGRIVRGPPLRTPQRHCEVPLWKFIAQV